MNLNTKQTETKPVVKENVFAVKPGQRAMLLVPTEGGPSETLTELLFDADLVADNEADRKEKGLPVVNDRINLRRLREDDVVFTAVAVPKKRDAKKQIVEHVLKISKGVAVKNLIAAQVDIGGEEVPPDFRLLVDEIQKGCLPFTCRVSQDHILSLRSV